MVAVCLCNAVVLPIKKPVVISGSMSKIRLVMETQIDFGTKTFLEDTCFIFQTAEASCYCQLNFKMHFWED